MNGMNKQQFLTIFKNEFRAFFQYPRMLMIFPFVLLGIFSIIWVGRLVHFFVILAVTLCCAIEPQFNNIFYRSTAEMEALTLFPVSRKTVILAKNAAAVVLSIAFESVLTVVLAYFAPAAFGWSDLADLVLAFCSSIFVLLSIGNARSLNSPRADAGWTYRDLNESLWMVGIVVIVTAPYQLVLWWNLNVIFALAYALITALYWKYVSLPATIVGAEEYFAQSHETLWLLSNSPAS